MPRDSAREVDALLAALGAAGGDPAPPSPSGAEPALLFDLARLNKALGYLDPGASHDPAVRSLGPQVAAAKLRIAAINLATLALSREVEGLLAARGLRAMHLKGPLQQLDLLGSATRRPSGDVDLLVRPRERHAAAAALRAAGLRERDQGFLPWWVAFLGEVHFERGVNGAGGVVDLHHRLDQPGLPRLRDVGALWEDARVQDWRGTGFLVPSRLDAGVVAALGVAKGLLGHTACAGHLVDLRAALDRLDAAEAGALDARAARLGLGPVLAVGRRALDAAFGRASGRRWSPPGPRPLEGVGDARLRLLLAAPWSVPPLRRRTALWGLSGGRPATFAARMAWMQMSDALRGTLEVVTAGQGVAQRGPIP